MTSLLNRIILLFVSVVLISLSGSSYVRSRCNISELNNVTRIEKKFAERKIKTFTFQERILFRRYLQNGNVLLEYGDGDAIPLYCRSSSLKTVIVISSDPSIQEADASLCTKHRIHFLPYYITLGEMGRYNSYIINASIDLWPNYVKSIQLFESFQPDLFFINGNLRFATLLNLLLQLLDDGSGRRAEKSIELRLSKVVVMVHDFFSSHYHPPQLLYLYYDFIDCIDSLVILKPKSLKVLNRKEIEEDYKKFIKIYV